MKNIPPNHPIRKQISECSSGKYYESSCDYFKKIIDIFYHYGLHTDQLTVHSNNGQRLIYIFNKGDIIGNLYLSWYKMDSGNWEMIGYIT